MRAPGALAEILDLLLPAGCASCGAWMPDAQGRRVCGLCRSRLRPLPWPRCPRCHHPRGTGREESDTCRECRSWDDSLTYARASFVLEGPAADLVHALKYEGWGDLAMEMGRAMARTELPAEARRPDTVIVPVPTTPQRVKERGYNQAARLAEAFADALNMDVVAALKRVRGGSTQVSLPPSERAANVKGVFARNPGLNRSLEGVHTVLVDDVLTTGATAAAAAVVLAELGVSGVTLVTYARALPFRRTRTS